MSSDITMNGDSTEASNTLAVENFRKYLRIPSVHPDINYDACIKFIEKQAKSLGLPIQIYHCFPSKPIAVLTWAGQEPDLPTILLNSHMDVVPVFENEWIHKPFSADIDDEGNIYARGAQDMKGIAIQYLEAIRRLKGSGIKLKRTVHVSFMPDEEIGGLQGMREFAQTNDFKDLNIGFALDEGLPSTSESYTIFNGERTVWQMRIHCPGEPGHGALLLDNTPGEKVQYILTKMLNFRAQEKQKLKDNPSLGTGDVTSINLTQMQGGVQPNVVPPEFILVFDCRIPITVDQQKWEETVNGWCKEAGEDVWIEHLNKETQVAPTSLDNSNPYWIAFKETADKLNMKFTPCICPGITDVRFVRKLGIPSIGFSAINNTQLLIHRENEYLNVNTFLNGISIYSHLITAVANV